MARQRSASGTQPCAEPVRFHLLIDDNYHYMDEGERRSGGTFDTYEEALAKAKRIVRRSVGACARGKETADEILSAYKMFGDDPWIKPTPEGVERFSAWGYAAEVADELARRRD